MESASLHRVIGTFGEHNVDWHGRKALNTHESWTVCNNFVTLDAHARILKTATYK
jgi:hypothetical protein